MDRSPVWDITGVRFPPRPHQVTRYNGYGELERGAVLNVETTDNRLCTFNNLNTKSSLGQPDSLMVKARDFTSKIAGSIPAPALCGSLN